MLVRVARFKEREENVKVDILHVYASMLKQIPRAAILSAASAQLEGDQVMETEGVSAGGEHTPHQVLLAQVPRLIKKVTKQMKEKGVRTRQGCLSLLTELVNVAPGALDSHVPVLIPGILYSLGYVVA